MDKSRVPGEYGEISDRADANIEILNGLAYDSRSLFDNMIRYSAKSLLGRLEKIAREGLTNEAKDILGKSGFHALPEDNYYRRMIELRPDSSYEARTQLFDTICYDAQLQKEMIGIAKTEIIPEMEQAVKEKKYKQKRADYLKRISAEMGESICSIEQCIETIVKQNPGLAFNAARKHMHKGLPLEDLAQHAKIGIVEAAYRFDPRRGLKFSTYASYWMKHEMQRAIENNSTTIRIPVASRCLLSRVMRADHGARGLHGESADYSDIAASMGINMEVIRCASIAIRKAISLDMQVYDDVTLLDTIADAERPDTAQQNELRERIERALSTLTPKEEQVIRLRFGIGTKHDLTLSEVGKQYQVTRERIRQIEEIALRKLKRRSKELACFL